MIDLTPYIATEGYLSLQALAGGSEFLDKLISDPEITDPKKEEFLGYLASYHSTAGDVRPFCEAWFRRAGNKFLGTAYPRSASPIFIRVNDLTRFKSWVNQITGLDVSATIDTLISGTFDDRSDALYALLGTPIRDDILISPTLVSRYLDTTLPFSLAGLLREAKTSEWPEWSSPWPDDEDDIMTHPKVDELDCRMGLSANRADDKIVYKHDITDCDTVNRPTVFDAEFYDQFRPGGKTIPLAECDTLTGFDEFIHSPNKFDRVIDLPEFIIK